MTEPSCVLITNGNTFSMIALAPWLLGHGGAIRKVFVTYRLPSSKGNLRGVWSLLRTSGWAYTYFKLWTNKILPMRLRLRGLPRSVGSYLQACGHSVPVEPVPSVNADAVVAEIRDLSVDYLVSFSATQRFGEPLIAAPRRGAINVHYGALPAYAGLSPYYWHLHNQQEQFGVTLHQIVPALDAGPIIEQALEPVGPTRSCLGLQLHMAELVAPMLCRFFEGTTTLEGARPQPDHGRSYFRHPTRADVRQFRRRGYRMASGAAKRETIRRVGRLAAQAAGAAPHA